MDIHAINNLGLRSVVMDQHLHPISHVVGHGAVLQDHQAPGGVDIEAIAPVAGDVSVRDGHQVRRVGDVEPVVGRVLHLDMVHHGGHAPGLNGGGQIELAPILAPPGREDVHIPEDRPREALIQGVLGGQSLVIGRGLEPETSPMIHHGSVIDIVEWKTLYAEVGMEVAHSTPHSPPAEVAIIDSPLMAETIWKQKS